MAVKFLQNYNRVNPCRNKKCKACGLYLNQKPIFDQHKKSHVFWVGLSAVQFEEDEEKLPLSPSTPSGSLVRDIERPFKERISFYRTNIVKCVPLKDDKIRYPLQHEMEKCFPNLEMEIEELNPSLIFLLGKQVSNFVLSKATKPDFTLDSDFQYTGIRYGNRLYVPVHHPSFVLVYKRKALQQYMDSLQLFIRNVKSTKEINLTGGLRCKT